MTETRYSNPNNDLLILSYFGGTDRGTCFDFIDKKTGKKITLSLLQLIGWVRDHGTVSDKSDDELMDELSGMFRRFMVGSRPQPSLVTSFPTDPSQLFGKYQVPNDFGGRPARQDAKRESFQGGGWHRKPNTPLNTYEDAKRAGVRFLLEQYPTKGRHASTRPIDFGNRVRGCSGDVTCAIHPYSKHW